MISSPALRQLFVACQLPLHLSPVMNPLQRPVPELPASRPPPFAQEAPTLSRTETLPLPVTPPVTLPPPADETRVPLHVERDGIGGMAIAGLRGECDIPGAVIEAHPGVGGGRHGDGAKGGCGKNPVPGALAPEIREKCDRSD